MKQSCVLTATPEKNTQEAFEQVPKSEALSQARSCSSASRVRTGQLGMYTITAIRAA